MTLLLSASGSPPLHGSFQPAAARIDELAAWLPAEPTPIGAPVSNRLAWTALSARLPVTTLLTEADRIVGTNTPDLPDDLYLTYSRTGNRSSYESSYNTAPTGSAISAGPKPYRRGRYLRALQREIDAILSEKTWILPAHDATLVNVNGRAVEIDLGASARGWSLALIAAWFGSELGNRTARVDRQRRAPPYRRALRQRCPPRHRRRFLVDSHHHRAGADIVVTLAAARICPSPQLLPSSRAFRGLFT